MSTTTHWIPELTMPVSTDRDHVRGPADAVAELVEYGDYECPFCGAAYPIVESLLADAGDSIRFAYRHFPLTTVHPHAERAAEAAEAAGAQGKFWPMHGLLFTNQHRLRDRDLLGYAQSLDLDVDRFAREMETRVHLDRVREDLMSGVRSGVNGTPTFFTNGIRHDGSYDARSLARALGLGVRTS
jgi:protein-disulfide isomerase